jgi:LemA protein
MYNRIIRLEQRAANSLANIDVELKRRASLIPNLVLVVKKYAQYETSVQDKLTQLRAKAVMSNTMKHESLHTGPQIMGVAEGYPDLKANEQFLNLMQNLTDTEERIAYSRTFYNRSVRKFNTLIQQFPFLLIAQMFKKTPKQFVNVRVEERAPVSVDI